jgi:hypothetical protein
MFQSKTTGSFRLAAAQGQLAEEAAGFLANRRSKELPH